jgi:hypothetical protein
MRAAPRQAGTCEAYTSSTEAGPLARPEPAAFSGTGAARMRGTTRPLGGGRAAHYPNHQECGQAYETTADGCDHAHHLLDLPQSRGELVIHRYGPKDEQHSPGLRQSRVRTETSPG